MASFWAGQDEPVRFAVLWGDVAVLYIALGVVSAVNWDSWTRWLSAIGGGPSGCPVGGTGSC